MALHYPTLRRFDFAPGGRKGVPCVSHDFRSEHASPANAFDRYVALIQHETDWTPEEEAEMQAVAANLGKRYLR